MVYFLYFVILLGIILFIYGVFGIYSLFFKGFLMSGSLKDLPKKFTIPDVGDYYISFPVQSDFIKDEITLRCSKKENSNVSFEENFFKFKFYRKNKKWSEFYKFNIELNGEYVLDCSTKNQRLDFDFIIAKAVSNSKKILSILACVFGFNITGFGILILSSVKAQILILGHIL